MSSLNNDDELFDIFDAEQRHLGTCRRADVHAKGLYHRSAHVIVVNSKGDVLLQKRSEGKKVCPGRWDLSAAEHLQPGESFIDAAVRGLKEEMGVETVTRDDLVALRDTKLFAFEYNEGAIKDYEFNQSFALLNFDGDVQIDQVEVSACRYAPRSELLDLEAEDERYCPWLMLELKYLKESGGIEKLKQASE